ncbi:hypothetical protein K8T06_18325, partial [bacterium]|nr:hypothetical protein [bacterium]
CGVGVVLYIIRSIRQNKYNFIILILLLLAAFGLASYHLSTWLFHDVLRSLAIDNPITYHQFPMETALRAGWSNYFWGIGAGNFPYLSGIYKNPLVFFQVNRAHNVYLELFAEFGISGLLAVIFAVATVLRACFCSVRHRVVSPWIHRGFRVALLLMIPAAFWDFGPQLPANLLMISFSAGFLVSDRSGIKKSQIQQKQTKSVFWITLVVSICFLPSVIAGCFYEMGQEVEKKGRWYQAIGSYRKAIFFSPWDDRYSAAAGLLGVRVAAISRKSNEFDEALEFIGKSLALNPNQAPLHYARAFILKLQSREKDFCWGESLRCAVKIDPYNHQFSVAYAHYLFESGDLLASLEEVDRIIPSLSARDYSSFGKSLVILWPDPYVLENYVNQRSDQMNPEILLSILQAIEEAGLDIIARPIAVKLARQLAPDLQASVLYRYTRLLFKLNEDQAAIDLLNRVCMNISDKGILAKMFLSGGDYYRRIKDYEKALEWYKSAKEANSDNVMITLRILNVQRRRDKNYHVLPTIEELVRKSPESYIAYFALAKEYQRCGMNLQAIQAFRKANALSGNKYSSYSEKLEDKLEIPDFWRFE